MIPYLIPNAAQLGFQQCIKSFFVSFSILVVNHFFVVGSLFIQLTTPGFYAFLGLDYLRNLLCIRGGVSENILTSRKQSVLYTVRENPNSQDWDLVQLHCLDVFLVKKISKFIFNMFLLVHLSSS